MCHLLKYQIPSQLAWFDVSESISFELYWLDFPVNAAIIIPGKNWLLPKINNSINPAVVAINCKIFFAKIIDQFLWKALNILSLHFNTCERNRWNRLVLGIFSGLVVFRDDILWDLVSFQLFKSISLEFARSEINEFCELKEVMNLLHKLFEADGYEIR